MLASLILFRSGQHGGAYKHQLADGALGRFESCAVALELGEPVLSDREGEHGRRLIGRAPDDGVTPSIAASAERVDPSVSFPCQQGATEEFELSVAVQPFQAVGDVVC